MKTNQVVVALLCLSYILLGCKSNKSNSSSNKRKDPVIATIGSQPIYTDDFLFVYKKNNAKDDSIAQIQNIKNYLDLYINLKLKVKDAQSLGLDTLDGFINEFDGYKKQLAQPYLTEKSLNDSLFLEAYERLKFEVNASHILISCAPELDGKDTVAPYNKLMALRKRIIEGESFEKLAVEFSEDPSAKRNAGNLGYFTSMQMVYPFESAAYNTPVNKISLPVRTRFGYHLVKVLDKRPSQGKVKVAHIMIRASEGMPTADSIAAESKINEIHSLLNTGTSWNTLVLQFSEDPSSKGQNGELNWFGTGKMIPSFEEAAFALKKPNDYSKPVRTQYGWHIIKLIEKKSLEPYDSIKKEIKLKVSKDSRTELNQSYLISRLKKENNFVEQNDQVTKLFDNADKVVSEKLFKNNVSEKENYTLFTIDNTPYKLNDFYGYLNSKIQSKDITNYSFVVQTYKKYVSQSLIDYEEAHLEEKYPPYRMIVNEYRDGILLFQMMDEKVWSKALVDTVGLNKYFESNRDNYQWGKRVKAAIYNVVDENTLNQLKLEKDKTFYPVTEPKLDQLNFIKDQTAVSGIHMKQLEPLLRAMFKDKAMFIEINTWKGNDDDPEYPAMRAKSIVEFMTMKGIDVSRIKINEKGVDMLVAATIGKIEINAFSSSKKALEGIFNVKNPLALTVTEGQFQKGENTFIDDVKWEKGITVLQKNNRYYLIEIFEVLAPRNKELYECRGPVISDYQNYLEKQWIKELRNQYTPKVIESEVNRVSTLLKK